MLNIWSAIVTTSVIFVGGLVVTLGAIRAYFRWTCGRCKSSRRLEGRTVLITGANTGLGREAARDLARRGARVLIAGRDLPKCHRTAQEIRRETGNEEVVGHECDLASIESVTRFAQHVHETESRLDILICNACASGSPYRMGSKRTVDGFEVQFQTNHLGHFLLINLLMDMIVAQRTRNTDDDRDMNNNNGEQDEKRIVLVSSSAHKAARLDFKNMARFENYERNVYLTYSDTKLMGLLTVRSLASRLPRHLTGVAVTAIHPGTILTNGIRFMPTRFLRWSHYLIALLYGKSVEDGAQTIIHCAVADKSEIVSGGYYVDCAEARPSRSAQDDELASRLWRYSAQLLRDHAKSKTLNTEYKYAVVNSRNL